MTRQRPSSFDGALARTSRIPFDTENPPSEPPQCCHDLTKWRWAYASYRAHEPNAVGRCGRAVCGEQSPCGSRQLALRALVDTCLATLVHLPLPGPGRIVATTDCRWCSYPVGLHSRFGWFHVADGFVLCRRPAWARLPLCHAEPATPIGTAQTVAFAALPRDQSSAGFSASATYTPTPGTP